MKSSDIMPPSGADADANSTGFDLSQVKTVEEFAARIKKAMRKSVEGMMETAALCARAQRELSREDLKALRKKLGWDDAFFSKHASIGQNTYLADPSNWHRLPASYTPVYELSQLGAEKLKAMEAKLSPTMQLKEAEQLRGKKGRNRASGEKMTLFCVEKGSKDLTPEERAIIKKARADLKRCRSISIFDTGVCGKLDD